MMICNAKRIMIGDPSKQKGFSIIEIMVVIAIIGTIMTAVLYSVGRSRERANLADAKRMLTVIQSSINQFSDDMDRIPNTLEELVNAPSEDTSKWQGPYLHKGRLPKDPWKKAYVYEPTEGAENPYELYSKGPKAGAKISVWDI